MATDTQARMAGRPRPWLLVLLGLAVAGYIATVMFSGGPAAPAVTTTAPQRPAPNGRQAQAIDPAELDVKMEALKGPDAAAAEGERNPFRFQPKAPPPPPPSAARPQPTTAPAPVVPAQPAGPPPPPPIGNTIKFIGIVDTGKVKIGAFSDCKVTFAGREGEILEGRYRIVRIGVESAVLEYVDGKGRTTLPLNGQACVK